MEKRKEEREISTFSAVSFLRSNREIDAVQKPDTFCVAESFLQCLSSVFDVPFSSEVHCDAARSTIFCLASVFVLRQKMSHDL